MTDSLRTLVSIIIPVYNSESFLIKCLNSVIQQTHKHLEIILINDGSTDNSPEIIDEYAAKDNRIVTIHKENGGIGSAYKAAFEVMTGDYVLFVDSDDRLELNAVENLVKLVVENDADMVHFGFVVVNSNNDVLERVKTHDGTIEGNKNILDLHFKILKHPSLCRLFRAILLKDTFVFEQNIGIDEMLIVQLLNNCKKAVYVKDVYYYALARELSVSRIFYSEKKIREGIRIYNFVIEFLEINRPEYVQYILLKYFSYLSSVYERLQEQKDSLSKPLLSVVSNETKYALTKWRYTFAYSNLTKLNRLNLIIIAANYQFLYKLLVKVYKQFLKLKFKG